jgi:hypothetical protein
VGVAKVSLLPEFLGMARLIFISNTLLMEKKNQRKLADMAILKVN